MDAPQLPGMPIWWFAAGHPRRDGRVVAVHACPTPLTAFSTGDLEMRDLAICSLTEGSRFQGTDRRRRVRPAALPGVADPRSRYRQHGARVLVHQMGRPPILSPARLRRARTWAGQGLTHAEIGRRLGVSRSRITELIKQHGTLPAPGPLFEDAGDTGDTDAAGGTAGQRACGDAGTGQETRASRDGRAAGAEGDAEGDDATWRVARRIETGTVACRYAGAMLVHAFTDRIGARDLLSAGILNYLQSKGLTR